MQAGQNNLKNFGKHLRKLRNERELSIRTLAATAGLEYSQVQRIEYGKVNFAFITLLKMADGLNISLQELLKDFKYEL